MHLIQANIKQDNNRVMDIVWLIGRAHLNEVLIKLTDYSLTCPMPKIMISYLISMSVVCRPCLIADELASPKSLICHKSMNYRIAWWMITAHNVSEQRKRTDTIQEENKNFYPLVMTQWSFKRKHTHAYNIIFQPWQMNNEACKTSYLPDWRDNAKSSIWHYKMQFLWYTVHYKTMAHC